MSGATTNQYDLTLNFGLLKPWIGQDLDQWGTHLNQNMDAIDNLIATHTEAGYLPLAGGTMTGALILARDPVQPLEAATKQYVDGSSYNVKHYGAIGDGIHDDTSALQAAWLAVQNSPTGGNITFPAGTYNCAASLNMTLGPNQGASIVGVQNTARIVFTNAGNGINVTLSPNQSTGVGSQGPSIYIEGLILISKNPPGSSVGINIQAAAGLTGAGGNWPMPCASVRRITFLNDGNSANGWKAGIRYYGTGKTDTADIQFGSAAGDTTANCLVWDTNTNINDTDHSIHNIHMSGGGALAFIGNPAQAGPLQGFQFVRPSCVGSRNAIVWQSTTAGDLLQVIAGQINTTGQAIVTTNVATVLIQDTYFVANSLNQASHNGLISITGGSRHAVTNNSFIGYNDSNNIYVNLTNVISCVVSGNSFRQVPGYPVVVNGTASQVLVDNNWTDGVRPMVTDNTSPAGGVYVGENLDTINGWAFTTPQTIVALGTALTLTRGNLQLGTATTINSTGGYQALGGGVTSYIRLGNQAGTPSSPYIDLYAAGNPAYDVRLQASGGTSSAGQGVLDIWADTVHVDAQLKVAAFVTINQTGGYQSTGALATSYLALGNNAGLSSTPYIDLYSSGNPVSDVRMIAKGGTLGGATNTWNTADSSGGTGGWTTQNGGLDVYTPALWNVSLPAGGMRGSVSGGASGKFYFEFQAYVNTLVIGLATAAAVYAVSVGSIPSGTTGIIQWSGSNNMTTAYDAVVYTGSGLTPTFSAPCIMKNAANMGTIDTYIGLNDVIAVAYDAAAQLVWFRNLTSGTTHYWNNSPSANPATGAGGISTAGLSSSILYPVIMSDSQLAGGNTRLGTTRWAQSSFTGTVPSGFAAWATSAYAQGILEIDSADVLVTGNLLLGTSLTPDAGFKLDVASTAHSSRFTVTGTAAGNTTLQITAAGATTAPPPLLSSAILQLIGQPSGNVRQSMNAAAGANLITFQRSEGTQSAPSATGANLIGSIQAMGYSPSGWGSAARGNIGFISDAVWTDTAQPVGITFSTTPDGSVTQAEAGRFAPSGNFILGSTVDTGQKLQITGTFALGPGGTFNVVGGTQPIIINDTVPTLPTGLTAPGATDLWVLGGSANSGRIQIDTIGTANPSLGLRKTGGTAAAPTAIPAISALGVIQFQGYDGTAWANGGNFLAYSLNAWSPTDHSIYFAWSAAPSGSTTLAEQMRLLNGNLIIGAPPLNDAGYRLDVKGSGRFTIDGTTTWLTLTANAAAPAIAAPPNTMLQILGADSTAPRLLLDQYGPAGGQGQITFRKGGGTAAAPTVIGATSTTIASINYIGHDGTGFSGSQGNYLVSTDGLWSATSHPLKQSFAVTAVNSVSPVVALTLASSADILIGTATDSGYKLDVFGAGTAGAGRFQSTTLPALTVDAGSGAASTSIPAGTGLALLGPDATTVRQVIMSFGTANSVLDGFNVGGTRAAPVATTNGRKLLAVRGNGQGTTTAATGAAEIDFQSMEAYTDTAHGAAIMFLTTPLGSVTQAEAMRIQPSGGVSIAGTTDAGYKLDVVGSARFGNVFTTALLTNAANDAAAASAGVALNQFYRNGSVVMQRAA